MKPGYIVAAAMVLLIGYVYMNRNKKTISHQGLKFIRNKEELRLEVYPDEANYPTIGYGHKLKPGENFTIITPSQAEALLTADVYPAVNAVNKYVDVDLNQNQFDALVSFVFNVGVSAFANSTLLSKLNAGDFEGAFNEFSRWNKVTINGAKLISQGLVNRRRYEQELFTA